MGRLIKPLGLVFSFLYRVLAVLSSSSSDYTFTSSPTYCISTDTLKIFRNRFKCIRNGSSLSSLTYLKENLATEYFRSHELLAHHFFVESTNPYRSSCAEASFEYIPLLPLGWLTNETLTNPSLDCSYRSFINDIVAFVDARGGLAAKQLSALPLFSAASTFNMRTEMGQGMPTPYRRGVVYEKVTKFVISLNIGHYERWPQCPDLLRKSWKSVIELPYLPIASYRTLPWASSHPLSSLSPSSSSLRRRHGRAGGGSSSAEKRLITFLFTGRLQLWGPERVCSVRNAIAELSTQVPTNDRGTVVVYNITAEDSISAVDPRLGEIMSRSIFCIIAKADSYSTASFYSALHAGCIPVVISDLFVFAFPWAVKYENFTVRVLEEHFLANPGRILDIIRERYSDERVCNMRAEILNWLPMLDFSVDGDASLGMYASSTAGSSTGVRRSGTTAASFHASLLASSSPFTLMLLELWRTQRPYHVSHVLTRCERPFACTYSGSTLAELALPITLVDAVKGTGGEENSRGHKSGAATTVNSKRNTLGQQELAFNHGGTTSNWTMSSISAAKYSVRDLRSHLCKHVCRLIGMYKIVYFMQCVRILWPLAPGKLQRRDVPRDGTTSVSSSSLVSGNSLIQPRKSGLGLGLTREDHRFVMNFHALTNESRKGLWHWTTYPPPPPPPPPSPTLTHSARGTIVKGGTIPGSGVKFRHMLSEELSLLNKA